MPPLEEGFYVPEHPWGEAFCVEDPKKPFMGDTWEGTTYVEAEHGDYAALAGFPCCLDT